MKTFFNVLYRRILYKIPLKFLLILLAVCAILFASVNANYYDDFEAYFLSKSNEINDKSLNSSTYTTLFNYNSLNTYNGAGTYCIKVISSNPIQMSVGFSNSQNTAPNNLYTIYNDQYDTWICLYGNKPYFNAKLNSSSNMVDIILFKLDNIMNSTYDCSVDFMGVEQDAGYNYYNIMYDSNTMNITNNYNGTFTITNNIDSNYCENNNLCPVYTGECENSSGVNWSSLYINNIQHIGGPNINIDIPEELSRDYDYIDEDMYIDVEGYNVDYDKITGIIDIQNYKPSQEDFNNIIGILADYMPIIVIFLGLLFIYSMIKKPFKSKLK